MTRPLVSTVIPVHNRPQLLAECVRSVLAQTWRPVEILIVDNGSTDATPETARRLAADHPAEVRVLECPVPGAGAAREVGRRAARGAYIQYLDSDDRLLPEKFTWQVSGLERAPECGVSYGVTRYRDAGGAVLHDPWKRTGERIETLFPSMLIERWWGTSTPLYRRALVDRAGPWLNLLNSQDWEYDCRIAAMGVRLHQVEQCVSEERDHPGERLSRGGAEDVDKLRARAEAHALILGHARHAGVAVDSPEMRRFCRTLFFMARECAVVGLVPQARRLFGLAVEVSGGGPDYALFRATAACMGWVNAGRIAKRLDTWRARS